MSDQIWVDDFHVLFQADRLMEFFPVKDQTHEERVNAIVRLSLYVSVLLAVYHSNVKYFAILVFFLAFTFVVYRHHPDLAIKEPTLRDKVQNKLETKFQSEESQPHLNNFIPSLGLGVRNVENLQVDNKREKCTKPTVANPFGNFTMADMMTFDDKGNIVDRAGACDMNDPEIKKMVDESFNNNLYKDVTDVFGKTSSQRNYYAAPSSTLVNDRESFQNWLYLSPKTCKESGDCLQYEDLRAKRPVFVNAERNPVSSKNSNAIDKLTN